jgi:Ca2+-binding RTX toxin-like protein
MTRTREILACALFCSLTGAAAAFDDGTGKEWRQLYETTALTWNQVAEVCPRDGVTPCTGVVGGRDLTNWIWATDAQVVALMGLYEPAILTASPPVLSGDAYFFTANGFLADMRYTFNFATEIDYHESTTGLTSVLDASGVPVIGAAGWGYYPISGGFSVAPGGNADVADAYTGVWLWRPIGPDYWPPVITPHVSGTLGNSGWYVSDADVTFDVQDPESEIISTSGCDPVSVTSDTTEISFICEATSEGGTSSASAFVKRDATAPTLTCVTPAPVFTLGTFGATVPATVTDATSGPLVSPATGPANTNAPGNFTASITGYDRAGNSRTRNCPYRVTIPKCLGLTPTIVGTGNPDTITGTSGRDIIVGLGGNDTISGGGGNDVICGNDGNDDLNGGNGNDSLDGGPGQDSIRGDSGRDFCTSGEIRMSSCEVF